MKIPEFFPGSGDTKNAPLGRSYDFYNKMARNAEGAWHDLGHTNVRFKVLREESKRGAVYVIRSNLVNGLPPQ